MTKAKGQMKQVSDNRDLMALLFLYNLAKTRSEKDEQHKHDIQGTDLSEYSSFSAAGTKKLDLD